MPTFLDHNVFLSLLPPATLTLPDVLYKQLFISLPSYSWHPFTRSVYLGLALLRCTHISSTTCRHSCLLLAASRPLLHASNLSRLLTFIVSYYMLYFVSQLH